jgi:hypothetical protein
MVRWELNATRPQTAIGQIVKKHIGSSDARNVDAMLDAYNTLHKGTFKSSEDVRRSFFRDGQPLLTPKQAENVFNAVQGKQKGGRDSLINETAEGVIDSLSGVQRGPALGPEAVAAMETAYKTLQTVLRVVLPFVFVLDTVQQTPLFGELIGAALDITASTLPVIAVMAQTSTPALVGLIPIPYAGTVGIILGWMFSAWFLWLAAVIALSRKDFAAALEATAGMIPVVGVTAMKIVSTADRVSTKLANRAEKIMESISHAYGSAMGAIQSVRSKIPANLPSVKDLQGKLPTLEELKARVPSAPLVAPVPATQSIPLPPASPALAPAPAPAPAPVQVKPEDKASFAPMKARRTGGRKRKNPIHRTRRNTRRGLKVARAYK